MTNYENPVQESPARKKGMETTQRQGDMKEISTETGDWQQHCWDLAHAGTAFEILNATPAHILFFEVVSATYEGKYHLRAGRLQLTFPASPAKIANP